MKDNELKDWQEVFKLLKRPEKKTRLTPPQFIGAYVNLKFEPIKTAY